MLVRIIILFLIFKFHKQIYQYLLSQNWLNLQGVSEKIGNTFTTAQRYITTNTLKQKMLELKTLDNLTYREVRKRLKNIEKMYETVNQDKDISLRNTYSSIKEEKKKIKNRISSLTVSIGIHEGSQEIIAVIENYINDIIKNILDIRDRRGINTDWFEGTWYDPVSAYDNFSNQNYDIYNQ